jgi:large-conductance mechanosensitive channel
MPQPIVSTWSDIFVASFQNLWVSFIEFIPRFIGAIIVFAIGWIIAVALGNVVRRLVEFLQIDVLVERLNIHKVFEKADVELSISRLIGWLVKWFLIVAFLIATADILAWNQVTEFLKDVAGYIPRVFVAVVILVAGMVAADFVYQVVSKAVKSTGMLQPNFVAGVAKWAILIFSVIVALDQLDIGRALLNTLVQGLVATIAIGAGLAFGLGGKEHAGKFLDRIRKDMSS